jgi:hypothetical protein
VPNRPRPRRIADAASSGSPGRTRGFTLLPRGVSHVIRRALDPAGIGR